MSSCPSSILPSSPPPAPRGVGFISLEEAARRSGKVRGHLARLCGQTWQAAGLAELRKVGKTKPTWWIREDADPSIARVQFPEQVPFDMSAIDKAHRDLICSREQILQEWESAVARAQAADPRLTKLQATVQFCAIARDLEGHRISPRTLQLWHNAYRAEGRAGLQDERKIKRGCIPDEFKPFIDQVHALWLTLRKPKLQTCYDHVCLIAPREGWKIPSIDRVRRATDRIDPRVVIKMRLGEKAFDEKVLPPVERDYTTLASNQIWCADHHQLDVIVTGPDGKPCRPWLTAWEDMRSRRIMGWHLFCHDPNAQTILIAFRHAVQQCGGVPEQVYVDNGKDFDSWALQGQTKQSRRAAGKNAQQHLARQWEDARGLSAATITSQDGSKQDAWVKRRIRVAIDRQRIGGLFKNVHTSVMHARPYNAKGKPIERFFYTLKTRFSQMLWPTYCGGKPQEKPEDLYEQIARGNAPAFADFSAAFDTWVDADYNARAHEGDGMDGRAPEDVWRECLVSLKTCAMADLDLLLQRPSEPATVTNLGVGHEGRRYGKGDPCLDAYFGKKVFLRIDPSDITKASAWTLDGDKLIGFLSLNDKPGWLATEQEYREAESKRKRVRNSVKAVQQLGPRRNYDTLDFMREKRASQLAAQRPDPSQPPPVLQPLRTPFEGQLAAYENAKQPLALRLAAGGERDVPAPPPKRASILDAAGDFECAIPAPRQSILERLGD